LFTRCRFVHDYKFDWTPAITRVSFRPPASPPVLPLQPPPPSTQPVSMGTTPRDTIPARRPLPSLTNPVPGVRPKKTAPQALLIDRPLAVKLPEVPRIAGTTLPSPRGPSGSRPRAHGRESLVLPRLVDPGRREHRILFKL
jgi:hypothetical protein